MAYVFGNCFGRKCPFLQRRRMARHLDRAASNILFIFINNPSGLCLFVRERDVHLSMATHQLTIMHQKESCFRAVVSISAFILTIISTDDLYHRILRASSSKFEYCPKFEHRT